MGIGETGRVGVREPMTMTPFCGESVLGEAFRAFCLVGVERAGVDAGASPVAWEKEGKDADVEGRGDCTEEEEDEDEEEGDERESAEAVLRRRTSGGGGAGVERRGRTGACIRGGGDAGTTGLTWEGVEGAAWRMNPS